MRVERDRLIDASEPDEHGDYEYHYEYDIYRFIDGSECLVARSYTDEPDEAHFLRIEQNGHYRLMMDADLAHPLLIAALDYLRTEGKLHFRWLSGRGNGYESVPTVPRHQP